MDKNPNTVLAALKALLTAVTYNAPPVDFGKGEPNLCYEARVPVGFVEEAQAAIASAEQAHAAKDSPTHTSHDPQTWTTACPACLHEARPHHHEAGGAPGREEIEQAINEHVRFRPPSRFFPGGELVDVDKAADAILALLATPSDQQGREQVIGELCPFLSIVLWRLESNKETILQAADAKMIRDELSALSRARSAAQ